MHEIKWVLVSNYTSSYTDLEVKDCLDSISCEPIIRRDCEILFSFIKWFLANSFEWWLIIINTDYFLVNVEYWILFGKLKLVTRSTDFEALSSLSVSVCLARALLYFQKKLIRIIQATVFTATLLLGKRKRPGRLDCAGSIWVHLFNLELSKGMTQVGDATLLAVGACFGGLGLRILLTG